MHEKPYTSAKAKKKKKKIPKKNAVSKLKRGAGA